MSIFYFVPISNSLYKTQFSKLRDRELLDVINVYLKGDF